MNNIDTALAELVLAMKADYDLMLATSEYTASRDQLVVNIVKARNYAKVVVVTDGGYESTAGYESAAGFVALKDNPKKGLLFGDLLKSSSWDAPATNFARGNLFQAGWQNCVRWVGIG